jgi:hypothetical protein
MRCRAVFSSVLATGLTLAFVPFGCASSIEAPRLYQVATRDESLVPSITAERLQACLETYQDQFSSGNIRVRYRVSVDKQGRVLSVETNDIPKSAPDFASCTRVSLREMTVPDQALRHRPGQSVGSTNGQTQAARGAMGDVLVVGAETELAELAVTAGGITVLLTIAIVLAVSGVTDIVDAIDEDQENKRRCNEMRTRCLHTYRSNQPGPLYGHSRCEKCRDVCVNSGGVWPSLVELGGKLRSCK